MKIKNLVINIENVNVNVNVNVSAETEDKSVELEKDMEKYLDEIELAKELLKALENEDSNIEECSDKDSNIKGHNDWCVVEESDETMSKATQEVKDKKEPKNTEKDPELEKFLTSIFGINFEDKMKDLFEKDNSLKNSKTDDDRMTDFLSQFIIIPFNKEN